MKMGKKSKRTITVRLNEEQHAIIQRLCRLKSTSQTAYLAGLATEQARDALLNYAVKQYLEGGVSISALVTETGLDVMVIMDAIAETTTCDPRPIEAFLAASKIISTELKDPRFYELALKAATK